MESRYAKDLKKAALAELEEAAASWRDTLEKYQLEGVDDPCMGEICLPWQMDDYRDADVMADEITPGTTFRFLPTPCSTWRSGRRSRFSASRRVTRRRSPPDPATIQKTPRHHDARGFSFVGSVMGSD